jgi:hypothetical protein
MRIIRWSGLPAVVRVKGRGVSAVAIPAALPAEEVLEMASLVLSPSEYQQVRHEVEPVAGDDAAGDG